MSKGQSPLQYFRAIIRLPYMKKIFSKLKLFLPFLLIGLFLFLSLILFTIIPSLFLKNILNISEHPPLILITIKQFLLLAALLYLPILTSKLKITKTLFALFATLYYTLIYFIIAYFYFTNNFFNPYFFIDSYDSIIETGKEIFGLDMVVFLLVTLGTLMVFFYYFFLNVINSLLELNQKWDNNFFKYKYLLVFPLIIIPIFPPHDGYFTFHYKMIQEARKAREYFTPYIPNYDFFKTDSEENIFMLQLESGNALALEGKMTYNGQDYHDNYIPNLTSIAKDGIFFPFFWGNSIQTDRAQENILCGIANNIGPGFAYKNGENLKNCLPNLLKKSGYKTIAFRSDDLAFHNMGKFMSNLGYDEIHYQDIMKPDDPKYDWGYDDCTFYQRAFEYLNKNYSNQSKLFVYFEVSTSHLPWLPKKTYAFTHPFPQPQNYLETYLNSSAEQDYCLSKFYQEYKNFNNTKTHLFILADTSWPVGVNNNNTWNFQEAFNENFLTFLLYIPPISTKDLFNAGKIVSSENPYGETDLPATILELLNNEPQANSFVFELKKKSNLSHYEPCQILVQPYSGGLFVTINGQKKYIYSVVEKKLTYFDLAQDFWEKNPQIIANDLSFQDFKAGYFCTRYK
jgi:hypothetical protein